MIIGHLVCSYFEIWFIEYMSMVKAYFGEIIVYALRCMCVVLGFVVIVVMC